MSYSSAGILALVIQLIINHDVLRMNAREEVIPAQRSYRYFLLSVIAYYITDIFWGFFYERQMLKLTYADTVIYFLAMAVTILLWTRFVIDYLNEHNRIGKMLIIIGQLIFVFQITVVLVNFIRPILFSFDDRGVYHAEIARYIILIAQIVMFAMTAVYAFSTAAKRTGTMKLRYRTIGLFSAAMAVFVTGQAFYPLLPLYAIGCLAGGCLLHSFVLENEKEEYRDDLEVRLKESIEKRNYYDMLTGLPNMTYFFDLADKEKNATLKKGGEPALLYMDFSGMKFYNGKYGFEEGDKLLKLFSKSLVRCFGNNLCCRIGGDHFAAITVMSGLEDKLQHLFRECENLNDGKSLPVHVGIYSSREGDIHASVACDRAKLACSELKGAYVSCFNYYSQEISDEAERRQYIIENIDKAIEENWIQVFYQPIVRAASRKTCEEEALSRWIDPIKGILSPADFIPALESAGLIYKLDLHVLELVLKKIRLQKATGFSVVPQSINLSRADFDACDIVEEIRKRVDSAGIGHESITVEITESIIGSDFDFIKEQILRFQTLGFPVWIDDFGSGYSSLDVLQSLNFDLIKFDMGFMRKLDEGDNGKIILAELMQMATSLGVDTICEGVETEEQARFLEEIGCSRLQGYYFSKPRPFERTTENSNQVGYENPEESAYYDAIGKINLYDLASIVNEDDNVFQSIFSTLPMSILEISNGKGRYVRSNQSYRDFMRRYFNIDILSDTMDFSASPDQYGLSFITGIQQCCDSGSRAFFEERMSDGSTVHCFVRKISVNPVTGNAAVAIAVLSITEPDKSTTYADIARALAADYYNLFVIDLDTNDYTEYSSQVGDEEMSIVRHGKEFFESARRDTLTRIYEEDREPFLALFTKENVLRDLDAQGVFTTTYRLIDTGTPMYVNMKITRLSGGNRIILGISIIDSQMQHREQYEELRRERESMVRVMALSDGYLTLFTIDPKTGKYIEYSSSDDFDSLGAKTDGNDFFGQAYVDAFTYCYEEDRQRFQEQVTQENVLRIIRERGSFSIDYRLIIRGEPRPVTLKAALFKEGGVDKLVVGVRAWRDRQMD